MEKGTSVFIGGRRHVPAKCQRMKADSETKWIPVVVFIPNPPPLPWLACAHNRGKRRVYLIPGPKLPFGVNCWYCSHSNRLNKFSLLVDLIVLTGHSLLLRKWCIPSFLSASSSHVSRHLIWYLFTVIWNRWIPLKNLLEKLSRVSIIF